MEVRMRSRVFVPAVVLAATMTVLSAQGFDLKLGQWEYTVNIKMPPEMLAKLPAAARAQMQQPQTNRSCLTAQDLKDLNLAKNDDDNCTVTSKKITGNVADVTTTCAGDEPHTQTMHYEALSRESMRGTIKMTGANRPSEMTITGKWIATACKE
jgi:Protein of unknown function (DUF3617)